MRRFLPAIAVVLAGCQGTTLTNTSSGGGDQCVGIQDLASQAVVPVAVQGQLASILPGGL